MDDDYLAPVLQLFTTDEHSAKLIAELAVERGYTSTDLRYMGWLLNTAADLADSV